MSKLIGNDVTILMFTLNIKTVNISLHEKL